MAKAFSGSPPPPLPCLRSQVHLDVVLKPLNLTETSLLEIISDINLSMSQNFEIKYLGFFPACFCCL